MHLPGFKNRRNKIILSISLPIIGGMLSQTLMNVADLAMLGHLITADRVKLALNAQALAGHAMWVVASFLIGIGSAVQSYASRRIGERKPTHSGYGLSMALIMAFAIGTPLSLLGIVYGKELMLALANNPDVARTSSGYFILRSSSWFLIMINFSFRGFFNGIGKSGIYLKVMWFVQIINIALSIPLIHGVPGLIPALGVTGAGLGTALATLSGSLLYFSIAARFQKTHGAFYLPVSKFARRSIAGTLQRLSVPAGLTGLFSSIGFFIFILIADRISMLVAAATSISIQVASLSFMPALGFGLAAASLVSRKLGAGKPEEAYRWGRQTAWLGSGLLGIVGIGIALFPDLLIGLMTDNPDIMQESRLVVQFMGAVLFVDATGNILSQALIGAGYVLPVLIANSIGMYLVFLPGAYFGGILLERGMLGIWIPLVLYRLLLTIIMLVLYRRRGWVHAQA